MGLLGPLAHSASAGGGEDVRKVFEGGFEIKVEPIQVELGIVEGRLHQMSPGEGATARVTVKNTSPATDWAIVVALRVGPTVSESYAGPLVTLDARWGDGTIYNSSDVIVLAAGTTKALSIFLKALDGAGTTSLTVVVERVYPEKG